MSEKAYSVKLFIDDFDATVSCKSIKILSSVSNIYPNFEISFGTTSTDAALEALYNYSTIFLQIDFLESESSTDAVADSITFDLIATDFNHILSESSYPNETSMANEEIFPITLKAIPRYCYTTTHSVINKLYPFGANTYKLDDILSAVLSSVEYSKDTLNDVEVDQFIIPPMTLSNAVNYIDQTIGIYKGPYLLFSYEEKAGKGYTKLIDLKTEIKSEKNFLFL